MDELIELLTQMHDDVDYETHEHLIDDKILNSFDLVMLIAMIGDTFDVRIEPEDITPEHFNSARSIWALIEEQMD
jgi:acyl carrier protein